MIINEIHYHPADLPGGLDNERDEFIELHNPDAQAADLSGWKLRNDADFTFPPGTVLPAGAPGAPFRVAVGGGPLDVTAPTVVLAPLPAAVAGAPLPVQVTVEPGVLRLLVADA